MWQALRSAWGNWRENRRQYQLERALYKAEDHEAQRAREDVAGASLGVSAPHPPETHNLADRPSVDP